jgi:hypothetical protein
LIGDGAGVAVLRHEEDVVAGSSVHEAAVHG